MAMRELDYYKRRGRLSKTEMDVEIDKIDINAKFQIPDEARERYAKMLVVKSARQPPPPPPPPVARAEPSKETRETLPVAVSPQPTGLQSLPQRALTTLTDAISGEPAIPLASLTFKQTRCVVILDRSLKKEGGEENQNQADNDMYTIRDCFPSQLRLYEGRDILETWSRVLTRKVDTRMVGEWSLIQCGLISIEARAMNFRDAKSGGKLLELIVNGINGCLKNHGRLPYKVNNIYIQSQTRMARINWEYNTKWLLINLSAPALKEFRKQYFLHDDADFGDEPPNEFMESPPEIRIKAPNTNVVCIIRSDQTVDFFGGYENGEFNAAYRYAHALIWRFGRAKLTTVLKKMLPATPPANKYV
jgi:hypothetical protein